MDVVLDQNKMISASVTIMSLPLQGRHSVLVVNLL